MELGEQLLFGVELTKLSAETILKIALTASFERVTIMLIICILVHITKIVGDDGRV